MHVTGWLFIIQIQQNPILARALPQTMLGASDLLVGWGTPSPFPTTSTPYPLHTFGHLTLDAFGIFEA